MEKGARGLYKYFKLKESDETKTKVISTIMLTLIFIGVLTFAFNIQPVKAEPKIVYVDASNVSDPLEDGTVDHPFDKIQEGIDAAISGDTVSVAAGTYYENITLKDRVNVLGSGADMTTIDGGGTESTVLGEWVVDPATAISGFTITNGNKGIHIKSYSLIIISNCIITGNQGDGIKCEYSNPTITNCNITDNGGRGINCRNSNITITNCIVTDHGDRGISIVRSSANVTGCTVSRNDWFQIEVGPESFADITNCVITNGEHNGVNVYDWYEGYTAYANVTNCVIVGFNGSGIGGAYMGGVNVVNCILWANGDDLGEGTGSRITASYSDIEDGDPGEGNIAVYPMFTNPGTGDYHLQAGSPCIDAGTNEDAPSTDFEGNPRPIDGDGDGVAVVDMGVYEFIPLHTRVQLTIYSVPTGVMFTVDSASRTTPWSGYRLKNTSVSLIMPEIQTVGDVRYYWDRWGDGDTSRSRTVAMTTNITLTAYYAETTPPTVTILSPENKTYPVNDVLLTFTISEPASWMGYSLDGQHNVTVAGNTTLSGLSDGSHSLIVYANDTAGNMGYSNTLYFTVDTTPPVAILLLFPIARALIISVAALAGVAIVIYFLNISKPSP